MKRLLPLLLLAATPSFGAGLRLFNPTATPLEATVVCGGVASRQVVTTNAIADVAGDDCRAASAGPLFVVRTETIDDVDLQTLDVNATAECPTPSLALPLTGCRFGAAAASVTPVDGATYAWTIEGGTLLSGAGTERVLIAIGSGLTLKVTATIASPACGVRNAAGIMALRDPFAIKSLSAGGSSAAGQPRTITWSYDNGTPGAQLLTGTDFGAVVLPAAARSYTYTPSLYGDKSVTLQATTAASLPGRTRAAGGGGTASSCTTSRAEAKFHVDCSTPEAKIEAPAATGVGMPFTARVKLAPGTTATWTIANATPATATGDSVSIQPSGAEPVDVRVTVHADTCTASAAAQVRVDAALGCANPPSAKLSIASSDCDHAVVAVALTGVPPFAGTWSDGQPFATTDRALQRTVTKAGDYAIKNFRDALCGGLSNSVTYSPTPTATISTNGATCLTGGGDALAILTFTGTPPFLGEWSDSIPFNTTATRLERKITAPADLTLKWFQDANCAGTISGHAGFGTRGTANLTLAAPANGCLMVGDPATPFATASVELTGTPPFTVTWGDGFEQVAPSSPAQRGFSPAPGATYPLTIVRARDAYCDLTLLNTTVQLAVTRYPTITAPTQLCPGVAYDASLVNPSSSSTISWRIDRGRIAAGQGTQKISFIPNDTERQSVVLYADVTDPSSCTATAAQTVKMMPSPGPIQLSISPTTIKLGESTTVNVSFNLADTVWVYTNLYDPIFQIVGWCQSGNSHCTFNWTPTVSGTLTIDSYGVPRCDKLNSSHTTATVVVTP